MSQTALVPSKKRILFVKLGAIGDFIMALPLSHYLVGQGHEVTWVCGKSVEPLVRNFSSAHHIRTVDDTQLLGRNRWRQLITFGRTFLTYLGRHYDEILIGHADPRYAWMFLGLRGKLVKFGQNIAGTRVPNGARHHSYEYIKLGTREDSGSAINPADYTPKPLKPWIGSGSKIIALAPGGARNLLADDRLRRWPLNHYRDLAAQLIAAGYQVHIFGSSTDAWVLEAFKDLKIKSRIGELNLLGFLEALSEVEALVTHDSGPLHLGGLAQVPVIGLFGPTDGSWRFPIGNTGRALQLQKKLPCQPCYDGKNFANCTENLCLVKLTPQVVFENLQAVLTQA